MPLTTRTSRTSATVRSAMRIARRWRVRSRSPPAQGHSYDAIVVRDTGTSWFGMDTLFGTHGIDSGWMFTKSMWGFMSSPNQPERPASLLPSVQAWLDLGLGHGCSTSRPLPLWECRTVKWIAKSNLRPSCPRSTGAVALHLRGLVLDDQHVPDKAAVPFKWV